MPEVVLEGDEPNGLAVMLAGLVEANIAADGSKARLLESARGAAQITVHDAGVTIGMKFVPGILTVTSGPVPGADVHIVTDADSLMGLSTVPLRAGLPDPLTSEGRQVVVQLLTRRLRVGGRPFGLSMLRTVNRLLNVA
jgi:hypothetical protein